MKDVGRFLTDAAANGRRFDLVLLDPPAFSAARGAGFAIDRDYPALIASACARPPERTACSGSPATRARAASPISPREGLQQAGREASLVEEAGLPADHPTLPAQPEDAYLQIALYRLS